jgi:hypothetical protein
MARIEDLIKDIPDPSLRNQIVGAVGMLSSYNLCAATISRLTL